MQKKSVYSFSNVAGQDMFYHTPLCGSKDVGKTGDKVFANLLEGPRNYCFKVIHYVE